MARDETRSRHICAKSKGKEADGYQRPRLLFLSHVVPYPPDGGVKIRTYHVLRILSRYFDVDALCFHRVSGRERGVSVVESIEALKDHVNKIEAFEIPQEHSYLRLFWDHFRSVVLRRPYTVFTYESREFLSRLRELIENVSYDLVHVDSLDLSRYLTELPSVPIVCTHHNVESELIRQRGDSAESRVLRAYLQGQAALLEREENHWCREVSLNVSVSERDRRAYEKRIPEARFSVVPNGVDIDVFRPVESDARSTGESGLVFVGGCTWFPNRDALGYFSEEMLPLIRERHPHVGVQWVGRADREIRREYRRDHGIEMTGYVEDIRPYVRSAACYIVPLRVGGGTRLKILDAWAMGKAVVSTTQGCEGLAVEDGQNILIRDTPSSFAAAVDRILRDPDLRRSLGRHARETAERLYSWDVIGAKMVERYRDLLGDRHEADAGQAEL